MPCAASGRPDHDQVFAVAEGEESHRARLAGMPTASGEPDLEALGHHWLNITHALPSRSTHASHAPDAPRDCQPRSSVGGPTADAGAVSRRRRRIRTRSKARGRTTRFQPPLGGGAGHDWRRPRPARRRLGPRAGRRDSGRPATTDRSAPAGRPAALGAWPAPAGPALSGPPRAHRPSAGRHRAGVAHRWRAPTRPTWCRAPEPRTAATGRRHRDSGRDAAPAARVAGSLAPGSPSGATRDRGGG